MLVRAKVSEGDWSSHPPPSQWAIKETGNGFLHARPLSFIHSTALLADRPRPSLSLFPVSIHFPSRTFSTHTHTRVCVAIEIHTRRSEFDSRRFRMVAWQPLAPPEYNPAHPATPNFFFPPKFHHSAATGTRISTATLRITCARQP